MTSERCANDDHDGFPSLIAALPLEIAERAGHVRVGSALRRAMERG
jgi:hypothetical protein